MQQYYEIVKLPGQFRCSNLLAVLNTVMKACRSSGGYSLRPAAEFRVQT